MRRYQISLPAGATVSIPEEWWSLESWHSIQRECFATGVEDGLFFEYLKLPNKIAFKIHTTFKSSHRNKGTFLLRVIFEQMSSTQIRKTEWGNAPSDWHFCQHTACSVWLDQPRDPH